MEKEIELLDYELPWELYAREPREAKGEKRNNSRMIVGRRNSDCFEDSYINNICNYLNKGDLIILNNSKTVNSITNIFSEEFGLVRISFSRKFSEKEWIVSIGIRKDLKCEIIGKVFKIFGQSNLKVINGLEDGEYVVSINLTEEELYENLSINGRPSTSSYSNKMWTLENYQNEYSSKLGSLEMPAAGRHFTNELIEKIKEKDINVGYITLHSVSVSAYIKEDSFNDHVVEPEYYEVDEKTAELIKTTKKNGNRIIAVGTTVMRTLESLTVSENYEKISNLKNKTSLAIYPGYKFKLVDGIVTNFHGPRSSRLALAASVIGIENIMKLYNYAIKQKYMFFEFGDTTLLLND